MAKSFLVPYRYLRVFFVFSCRCHYFLSRQTRNFGQIIGNVFTIWIALPPTKLAVASFRHSSWFKHSDPSRTLYSFCASYRRLFRFLSAAEKSLKIHIPCFYCFAVYFLSDYRAFWL